MKIEEDEPMESIKYTKFEPYMLKGSFKIKSVLKDRDFEPDDPETLLAAFKMLDPEGKGYIEIEEMRRHLETEGYRRMLFQNRIQSEGNSGFY
jgi:calmodulin